MKIFIAILIFQTQLVLGASFGTLEDLLVKIENNNFEVSSCVASLQVNEHFNKEMKGQINKTLRMFLNDKRISPEKLYHYHENGILGLRACLEGNYEDVTILSQAADPVGSFILLEKKVVVEGEVQYRQERLDPKVFRNYVEEIWALGKNIKQITLSTCNTENITDLQVSLRELIKKFGLNLKIQPYDPLASLLVPGDNQIRSQGLVGYLVAENAWPSFLDDQYCLVPNRTKKGVLVRGETNCGRGKFQIKQTSFAIGIQDAHTLVKFKQSELKNKVSGKSFFSVELGFRAGVDFNGNRFTPQTITHTQHHGFAFKVDENIVIRSNHMCESDLPAARLICFDRLELLHEILEEDESAVNQVDAKGKSLLHYAAMTGKIALVKKLIAMNAPINQQDCEGVTAFMESIRMGHREVALYFLKNPLLDKTLVEFETGDTALHLALQSKEVLSGSELGLIKDLVRNGYSPFTRNRMGKTAYHLVKGKRGYEFEVLQERFEKMPRSSKDLF